MTVVFQAVPAWRRVLRFCCSRSIFKLYTAATLNCVDGQCSRPAPAGSWASCRKCSELVDGKQWSRLTERALRKFLKRHDVPRHEVPTLSAQFAEIHRLFAEHLLKGP